MRCTSFAVTKSVVSTAAPCPPRVSPAAHSVARLDLYARPIRLLRRTKTFGRLSSGRQRLVLVPLVPLPNLALAHLAQAHRAKIRMRSLSGNKAQKGVALYSMWGHLPQVGSDEVVALVAMMASLSAPICIPISSLLVL